MEEKEPKTFELNTKILDNFEEIMATKLDEIQVLKVTSLDQGSKLLNIISLCANVKTLILEGDTRLHCDKILANIFKPEKLEKLVFNQVKLPSVEALKRFTNLKILVLNEIRFCQVKDFLDGIVEPEKIEMVDIANTDMMGLSVTVLEKFTNLKTLNLQHIQNLKLDELSFLKKNEKLLKMSIINNKIPLSQLKILLKCKSEKNIVVNITDKKGNEIQDCKLKIDAQNKVILSIAADDLEQFSKEVNFAQMDRIYLLFHEAVAHFRTYDIKLLKKYKKELHVMVKDFSCLDTENARKIKNLLKVEKIEFEKGKSIDIIDFMEIREEMEHILQNAVKAESEVEKFLEIYKVLGKEFQMVETGNLDIKSKTCTFLQMCEFLQNCLNCLSIHSNLITGEDLEEERKHYWNQVELEGKWYNVDLGLDLENIKKNKTEYCLLGDKNFFETHKPKSGKNHFCEEDFNPKLVSVFFKTGLLKESLVGSYLEMMIEKIKKLFAFNKKQEVLALPEANNSKEQED